MKKLIIILSLLILSTGCVSYAETQPYFPSTDAKLEYNAGIDFYKLGQYDKAMSSFRHAIELDPNYIDAYYNLGSILEYLKQYDAALTVFKQIIVRKPDDYESVYKAAVLSVKLGQPEKAKSYLSLIPADTPASIKAQELLQSLNTSQPAQDKKAASTQKPAVQDKTQAQAKPQTQQQSTNSAQNSSQSNGIYENIISPTGITSDKEGNIYVACFSDNSIYKITPDGKTIIFLKDNRLNGPIGMISDETGNIYISNYNNNNVLKVSNSGAVSVLISNVQKPYGMHITGNMLYVASQGTNSVLRYKLY